MKKIIPIVLATFLSIESQAQFKTLNSANGEGRVMTPVFSQNRLAGQLSAAYVGNLVNNFQNPASYADASLTTIEVGAMGQMGSYTYNDSVKSSGGVGLSNFSILLPLSSGKSGLNLGFYQHTNTNYGIKSLEVDPTFGTFTHQRTGVGNLYRAFVGAGFRFGKLKVGGNVITQFGRNDYLDDVRFADSLLMPVLRKRDAVTQLGLDYNLGTQYELEIDNSKQLIFGAYYNGNLFKSGSTDKVSQHLFPLSSTSSEYITLQDTNYSVDLPSFSKFGIGMSFINKKSLLVGTEFNYENYSNFTDRFSGQNLNNAWHMHFGVEYKPYMNRDNDTRKYFNRVTYRLGSVLGKSEQLYTGSFNELKFMGGATLPILGRNVGYITLGMEYATRGFGGNAQIADNILSFNLILTFADKWFLRPKFD